MSETRTELDYPVLSSVAPADRAELIDALRAHQGQPVRLLGGGSAQAWLPAPEQAPTLLRLSSMAGITRLDPDDLTCSVEPGLRREELDAALAEHGLWLPCPGTGTLAGLCAADLHAPMAPGGLTARSLLLGLEGVLAEGLPFKCGASVVKSVAGFDLQKAFVGSAGRLFAATLLHLKLRPRPPALRPFGCTALDLEQALSTFGALRSLASPAHELWLRRTSDGHAVTGALAGHAGHVAATLRQHELEATADAGPRRLDADPPREIVCGQLRPSRLPRLLAALPDSAPVLVCGTGQFEAELEPRQTDDLLRDAPEIPAAAVVRSGAPERRGRATPVDPGVARLTADLRAALDPKDMLQ